MNSDHPKYRKKYGWDNSDNNGYLQRKFSFGTFKVIKVIIVHEQCQTL